ncbi:MAG TPA: geranylgeranylglyceryl/heptaprenylglyceryl phosphate synthase [Euryarchaeota archaeon]|nr:geranylgeranylglyceryl/heptaprenylglyceryl phosphate synthase [Euryarchaeota archaeon]
MSVLGKMYDILSKGPVHIALIDPDKQGPEKASEMAKEAEKGGSHFILIGGTTGVDTRKQKGTIQMVCRTTDLPVIIFPTSADILFEGADAVFYMSLLNSRNVRYVIGEAVRSSLKLASMEIEVIPVGYIVFHPGMIVGKVGEVDLIGRDDLEMGMSYAKAVELLGMEMCYLEGGSGVEEPIPSKMIEAIRSVIDIPIIVGGGIDDPESAAAAVRAGADIIVTGTLVETSENVSSDIGKIIRAMNTAWKERGI